MIALQLWSSCEAVCHMGLLTKWSITEIRRSLTQLLWGKTRARKGEVLDPLNNLIPSIIPKFNLVKFTFTQIKPHSKLSCLNLHYPDRRGRVCHKCNFFCSTVLDVLHTDVSAFVLHGIIKSSLT